MANPDNPRDDEDGPCPRQFVRDYGGRSLIEVAAKFNEQLLARPGWMVDANVPTQVMQKIPGGIIPLAPIKGKNGKEARELLAGKRIKYGEVLPVIAYTPDGEWCPWESGYLRLTDLDKSVNDLFEELKTLAAKFFDKKEEAGYKEKWDQWAVISMLKLALIAKTPWEDFNDSALVEVYTILSKGL